MLFMYNIQSLFPHLFSVERIYTITLSFKISCNLHTTGHNKPVFHIEILYPDDSVTLHEETETGKLLYDCFFAVSHCIFNQL